METVTIDRYLYLTEDRSRVVPEGHPESRFLWASPGSSVPREEAERLGAIEPAPVEPKEQAKPADKQQDKPADKQRTKTGDKAATVAELRQRATELGVQVDNRWGVLRLQQEIASAQGEG